MLTAHYGIEPTTFRLKDALPHSHSRPYVQQHVRCNVILHVECTWMQMYLEIQYTAYIEYVKVCIVSVQMTFDPYKLRPGYLLPFANQQVYCSTNVLI